MGKLRERLDRYHAVQEECRIFEQQEQEWERGLNRVNFLVDRDENGPHARANALQRGMALLLTLEGDVFGNEERAQELIDEIANLTYEDVYTYTEEVNAQEQFDDVQENFLFAQWVEQLDEPKSIPVFSHYCVYVSLKAAVNLISEHMNGNGVLQYEVGKTIEVDREAILELKSREEYDSTNPEWFIQNVLAIPGMWQVSQALLNQYSEQVRLEGCTGTALPDTLYATGADVPDYRIRMRQAIHAYAAQKGSLKELAKKYDVPRRQLEAELKSGGLMRRHGGDRKG